MLSISVFSVIWISKGRRSCNFKLKKRKLSDGLNLALFVCDGLKAIHLIILVSVDFVFHEYYAIYEQAWKIHPLCILLNMLLYTLVLVTLFLFLLMSSTRMIACAFPFYLPSVSLKEIIWATIIFFSITLSVSYLPYSGISSSHINKAHTALGFGLVIPVVINGQPLWSLLGYVFPMTSMLLVSCVFQLRCICALLKTPKELRESSMTFSKRRGSAVRCIVTMMLPLCCHIPLLILHVVAASNVEFPPSVSVSLTMFTLIVSPIINAIIYIVITPAFIEFSLQCLRRT